VDHAHLHAVPFAGDLRKRAEAFLPTGSAFVSGSLLEAKRAVDRGEDYLFIREPSGNAFVATHHNFESQTFRMAIATSLGMSEQYNWREYPQAQNVDATLGRLRDFAKRQRSNRDLVRTGVA